MRRGKFGAEVGADGVTFRLWAPDAEAAGLCFPGEPPRPMKAAADGFFELAVPGGRAGQAYRFRIGDHDVPDPASRGQAEDADGWSVVQDFRGWATHGGAIRPWHEAIIAELHVGTATPDGTFDGLLRRLDHFADAGYTALELMPVADFPGACNWGYDGVLPFAPERRYGTPEDLRALVDAAHARGLGMILDVVYNHFGPTGNFLPHYARRFFTDDEPTPWGAAINLREPIVRAFFRENVRLWIGSYDFDGLRFDAVHALKTAARARFLGELAATARSIKPDAWLIVENDRNEASLLPHDPDGNPRAFSAQWNDDFHHAFSALADATSLYADDYLGAPARHAARVLAEGLAYQGEPSAHRGGVSRGEPSAHLPPAAFVAFIENHDQIGNRPLGDRLAERLAPERLALLRFILLLAPQVPLLFMGDEVEATTRFPFFGDYSGEMAEAVRSGRLRDFHDAFALAGIGPHEMPDPTAAETLASARLPWAAFEIEPHRSALARFRALAALRRELVWPLAETRYLGAEAVVEGDGIVVRWHFAGGTLTLAANLADREAALPLPVPAPQATVGTPPAGDHLAPWSAAVWAGHR